MSDLRVVKIAERKGVEDFKKAVDEIVESEKFGHLTFAETIGALQMVILDTYQRLLRSNDDG